LKLRVLEEHPHFSSDCPLKEFILNGTGNILILLNLRDRVTIMTDLEFDS
jgi:hypothetical protein